MAAFDDDDLANLLSEDDLHEDTNDGNPSQKTDDLAFVDYDNELNEKEPSNSNDTEADPFDGVSSSDDERHGNEVTEADLDNDDNSDDDNKNVDERMDLEEAEQEHDDMNMDEDGGEMDDTDWDEVHPWPEAPSDGPFASRVIVLEHIPVSMNEDMIIRTLFHDIPTECHPIDIRLFHHRHYLSQKNNRKLGYAQLIFENADILASIMPLLTQKEANNRHKFRLCIRHSLRDIVTDHYIHRDLKDQTLRLVFINLHWKCKALHIYQFIQRCLISYKKQHNDTSMKITEMLPIKIQIIEDNRSYMTGCAYVDFCDALTASKVLFACHGQSLLDRRIYVDWNPCSLRLETWMKQQNMFKQNRNTRTLLICNLHRSIRATDIREFIEKHLAKIKQPEQQEVIIKDVHLIHNKNDPLLCGYCLVSFIRRDYDRSADIFDVIQELLNRIQYKVLQHRSIFAMFTRTTGHYYYDSNRQQNGTDTRLQKHVALKDTTRFVIMHNLAWNVSQKNIVEFIKQCSAKPEKLDEGAEIHHSINIIVDSNGYPIGKALIKCLTPKIATSIITELEGKLCRNRPVFMDWCDEKRYKSVQSAHNNSVLNLMEFSSKFNSVQMNYFYDQLYGAADLGNNARAKGRGTAAKTGKMAKAPINRKGRKNSDFLQEYKHKVWTTRRKRGLIFKHARTTMIDLRMLNALKNGKTLQEARPKTLGQLREQERKGKVGIWTDLGMSKAEMLRLKDKVDWTTGKSVLSKVIAAKKTIHVKDYWSDSIKYSRRRNNNRWYIQKASKHSKFRKSNKNSKKKKK